MDLLCLIPPHLTHGHDLAAALRAGGGFDNIEQYPSAASLSLRLTTPVPDPCLLLIVAETLEQMRNLMELRAALLGRTLVMLVNQQPPQMLGLAHRLHPRLVAPLDTDINGLALVFTSVLERIRHQEEAYP